MARKKQQQRNTNEFDLPKEKGATLADQLGGDVLAKLKAAKKEMVAEETAKEEGTYDELSAAGGIFERMVKEQQVFEQQTDSGKETET